MDRSESNNSADRVARLVRWALLALVVAVFGAFFLVGYHRPWADDPDYNAPQLTVLLIGFQAVLLIVALAVVVASVIRSICHRNKADRRSNGIATTRIAWLVALTTAGLLALTFCLTPPYPLTINGQPYDDMLGIRLAGMFIGSSVALIAIAIVAIVADSIQTRRYAKEKNS